MVKTLIIFLFSLSIIPGIQAMKPADMALAPERFPLQALVAKGESYQAKLKKLQMIANFLVIQQEAYVALKKMIPLFEELYTLQPYRVIDNEGKEFLSAFRLARDENCERYSKFKNEHGRPINQINVYVPEAQALAFQLIPFFLDWKLKRVSQAHLIDKYLKHDHENIRAVAGLVKHMVYSMQLAHTLLACPSALLGYNDVILNRSMESEFPALFGFDSQTFALMMQLACMKEMIYATAQLIGDYQKSGQHDDIFEIYIGQDCLHHIAQAKNVCAEFEKLMPKFMKLYDDVRNAMVLVVLKSSRDNDIRQNLRNVYYARIPGLFNTASPCQLERPRDLTCYFTSPQALPASLDFKVVKLELLNGSKSADNRNSFLPVTLSKSAPASRTPASGKKKKNKSHPSSRSPSPCFVTVSGSKNSPNAPQSELIPVIVQPKPMALSVEYDERVLDWFDPDTTKEHILRASRESIEYHCFTRLADRYLFKYGIQTPWNNQTRKGQIDTNYSLGGMIERPDQKRQNVVFTCCKDIDGVCYHRGFEQNDDLFNEYFQANQWKVLHRDEFPQLGEAHQAPFAHRIEAGEDKVIREDDLCIKIQDGHLNMNIVLYKPILN